MTTKNTTGSPEKHSPEKHSEEKHSEENRSEQKRSAAPARNAVHHGLLAGTVALDCESPVRFSRLAEAMRNQFLPITQVERDLVENMTVCRWRLWRLWNIERTNLTHEENRLGVSPDRLALAPAAITGLAFRHLADNSRCLHLLNSFETRFVRQYNRSLASLLLLRRNSKNLRNEPAM